MPLSQHEEHLFSRLCSTDVIADDYVLEEEGYDDDDISVVSSCMGEEESHENIDLEEFETVDSPSDLERWKELTESEKVESAADGLKKLGNAKRRQFNPLALRDGFVYGDSLMMKSIKKNREKAIRRTHRKFELVQMSINYFAKQMEMRGASLKRSIARSQTHVFVPSQRGLQYRKSMKERRLNNLTNRR